MKTKLTLGNLKIKSFVTELGHYKKETVKGGLSFDTHDNSQAMGCTDTSPDICPDENSVGVRCTETGVENCASGDTQQNSINNCSDVC